MDVATEPSSSTRDNHCPVDVVHSWIALDCPENVARFRPTLGQPCHHIVAQGHFSCSPALCQDKPHDPSVEINFFPFKRRRLSQPCSSYQEEVGHRPKGRLKMMEHSGYLVGGQIVNHPISRSHHQLDAGQGVAGYPLLFDSAVQHASQRADFQLDRALGNVFSRTPLIHVLPSSIHVFPNMVGSDFVHVLDGQPLENGGQRQVGSQSMFLAAVGQKPLDVFVGKLRQEWTSPVPILNPKVEVSSHLLLDLSALLFALRLCGHTYLLPPMPKSRIPYDLPVASDSFPWHTPIQQ